MLTAGAHAHLNANYKTPRAIKCEKKVTNYFSNSSLWDALDPEAATSLSTSNIS